MSQTSMQSLHFHHILPLMFLIDDMILSRQMAKICI
jgi:hypothetical protein